MKENTANQSLAGNTSANISSDCPVGSCKVLIVDDEKDIATMLRLMVEKVGCQADYALSGQEALQCIEENEYTLVFVDVNLPDGSGLKLIPKIKERLPETLFVVMTGENTREMELATRKHKIFYYLVKPFSFTVISDLINCITTMSDLQQTAHEDLFVIQAQ